MPYEYVYNGAGSAGNQIVYKWTGPDINIKNTSVPVYDYSRYREMRSTAPPVPPLVPPPPQRTLTLPTIRSFLTEILKEDAVANIFVQKSYSLMKDLSLDITESVTKEGEVHLAELVLRRYPEEDRSWISHLISSNWLFFEMFLYCRRIHSSNCSRLRDERIKQLHAEIEYQKQKELKLNANQAVITNIVAELKATLTARNGLEAITLNANHFSIAQKNIETINNSNYNASLLRIPDPIIRAATAHLLFVRTFEAMNDCRLNLRDNEWTRYAVFATILKDCLDHGAIQTFRYVNNDVRLKMIENLHWSVEKSHDVIIVSLLLLGVPPDSIFTHMFTYRSWYDDGIRRVNRELTPLQYACSHECFPERETIKLLLLGGANPNTPVESGWKPYSALHILMKKCRKRPYMNDHNLEVMKALLTSGASLDPVPSFPFNTSIKSFARKNDCLHIFEQALAATNRTC